MCDVAPDSMKSALMMSSTTVYGIRVAAEDFITKSIKTKSKQQ